MKDLDKRLHINVELWASQNPKEALLLPYREDPELKFCKTKTNKINLVRFHNEKKFYYHSNVEPDAEAERWTEKLNLQKEVIYVFGIGLGYYYLALKQWLKENPRRALVFLENDLGVIRFFFQTETATDLLKNSQVALYYFKDLQSSQETFDALYWNYILTQMDVSALNLYKKLQKDLTDELHHKIIYDAAIKNALVEEYLRFGANFFKNFYANQLYLSESYHGNSMFGKMKDIPAIICGAGPSLQKALSMLPHLRDRALIFAGGSSLNALSNAQILPHFGAGIDPNPTQLERLSTSSGFEVPFFYRNRLLHEAFRKIHGPKLYVTGSGGYDIAEWFENKLNIKPDEYLDEGHNIVNFCLQIAHRLGCNPIIFVGMDLGFTGMQTYASGIEKKVKITKKELTGSGDFDKDALIKKDIHGKPLYTLWKWIAEADWIGNFAKEHPEVTLLNCTEAGLGFPGVPNFTLKETSQKHLTKQYDLANRIHAEIQACAMPQVTQKKVNQLMDSLYKSLKNCIELLTTLIKENEELQNKIKKEKTLPQIMQSGKAALAETELAEEEAFQYILELFNHIYALVLNIELKRIRMSRLTKIQQAVKKLTVNHRRLIFLKDVVRVNLGLIELAWRAKEIGDMPTPEVLAARGMNLSSCEVESLP